jgi:hypothetical protein
MPEVRRLRMFRVWAALAFVGTVAACGHGPSGTYVPPPSGSSSSSGGSSGVAPSSSLIVSVVGLNSGGSFVLKDNAGDSYTISTRGSSTLKTHLAAGAAYTLEISTQPTQQFCNVQNAAGTAGSSAASNISIACAQVLVGGSGAIPASGGTVSTAAADVKAPPGASLQPQNVTITTLAPPAGLPPVFTAVGAAVDVSIDQPTMLNAPLLVTVPYDASVVSSESNLAVVHYNTTSSRYEPAAIVSQDTTAHTFTIATRVFSPFVVVQFAPATAMPASFMVKNFSPKKNGWNIENTGDYFSPGGDCFGMSAYAIWFFNNESVPLYGFFPTTPDPSIAVIVASRAQMAEAQYELNVANNYVGNLSPADNAKFMRVYMAAFNDPQVLIMLDAAKQSAHAAVLYGYNSTGFIFYDTNYPGMSQTVGFNGSKFAAYGIFTQYSFAPSESLGRLEDYAQLTSDAEDGFIHSGHITVTSPDVSETITSAPVQLAGSFAAGLDPTAVLIAFTPDATTIATQPGPFSVTLSAPLLGPSTEVLLAGTNLTAEANWYPKSDTYIFDMIYEPPTAVAPGNPTVVAGSQTVFTAEVPATLPSTATYQWTLAGDGSIGSTAVVNTGAEATITYAAPKSAGGSATLTVQILDAQSNVLSSGSTSLMVDVDNGCFNITGFMAHMGSTYTTTSQDTGTGDTTQTSSIVKGAVAFNDPPYTSSAIEVDTTMSYEDTGVPVTDILQQFYSNPSSGPWLQYGDTDTSTVVSSDGSSSTNVDTFLWAPPVPYQLNVMNPGQTVTITKSGTVTDVTSGAAPIAAEDEAIWTYVGQETVTVPAGTFKTCHFTTTDTSDPATSTDYWLTLGTSIPVKQVDTTIPDGQPSTDTQVATAVTLNGQPYTGP